MLELLATARFYYNLAEIINIVNVASAVLLSVLAFSNDLGKYFGSYEPMVLLLFMFLPIVIKYINSNIVRRGAYTKELIDCKLFDLEINDSLWKFKRVEIEYNAKKLRNSLLFSRWYTKQMSHDGDMKPKGIKDWYYNKGEIELLEETYKCQLENLYWDKNITKKYISAVTFVLILLVVVASILWIETNFGNVLLYLMNLGPIIVLFGSRLYEYIQLILIYEGYSATQVMIKESNIHQNEILILQRYILKRRLLNYMSVNYIHSKLKDKLHIGVRYELDNE